MSSKCRAVYVKCPECKDYFRLVEIPRIRREIIRNILCNKCKKGNQK